MIEPMAISYAGTVCRPYQGCAPELHWGFPTMTPMDNAPPKLKL